jgi:hypothetical protein
MKIIYIILTIKEKYDKVFSIKCKNKHRKDETM